MVMPVRTSTLERHAIGSHTWQGFNHSNIVDLNIILECNTLTVNSAIALMTSHNIVDPNITSRATNLLKAVHRTRHL
jgi:hypothetical protein